MYSWKTEAMRIGSAIALAALVAWVFSLGLWPVVIVLIAILGWILYKLNEIDIWLQHRRDEPPPESHGLLGQILDNAYLLRKDGEMHRERLQALVDYQRDSFASMSDAVVMLDEHANIEWCNSASTTLLSLRPDTDVGQHICNLLRNPEFVRYFEREHYDEPLQIDAPANRNIKLLISITFFGRRSRLLFARDITRNHQLEEMRRGFVANVSHELRTPLTVISSYLETLSSQPMPSEQWQKAFDQMSVQTQRMRQLVEDLMALSQLDAAPRRANWAWVDVGALVETLRDELVANANGEREISIECEPGLQLFGNANELRSAFSNLVVNAARYTNAGDRIHLRWARDKQRATFSVTDSGIGIEPRHIPRLTERFYRVDESRSSATGGTGLGLAIVKHVVMRHRGVLEIQSQPGRGSTFTCRFPAPAGRVVTQ